MNHEYKTRCHTTREWLAYQHKQRTQFLNKIRKARQVETLPFNTTDDRPSVRSI